MTTGSGADVITVVTTLLTPALALTGTLNAGAGANTLNVTLGFAETVNFTGATLIAPCISKEVRSYQRNHQGVQPMNNETDLRRQISW